MIGVSTSLLCGVDVVQRKRVVPMLGDGALGLGEYASGERVPLAAVHDAVLEFLRGRDDAVGYGSQAVNGYVRPARMTEDVDVASTRPVELADELRGFLNRRFYIAVRVRNIRDGLGYRVYQARKPENRHLVDVRPVKELPPSVRVGGVLVVAPPELIANKVMSVGSRRDPAKALTDRADLYRMLRAFPELLTPDGAVQERLTAAGATDVALAAWRELLATDLGSSDEDDKFNR